MHKWFWNARYLGGKLTWDTGVTPPEVASFIESGQIQPGRALDIGCGTGTNAIYLAKHGFQVTGIDISSIAILRANLKARHEHARVKFIAADILTLGLPQGPAVELPFDLVIDIGCLHSIAAMQMDVYSAMLKRVLNTGGYYMLYAWAPRQRHGKAFGLTPQQLNNALGSEFHSDWVHQGTDRGAASNWYLYHKIT